MWIIKKNHSEYYDNDRDECAVITCFPDDHATLTIRKDKNGELVFKKDYASRKGARIALGRFGKWRYMTSADTFCKGKTKGELHKRMAMEV